MERRRGVSEMRVRGGNRGHDASAPFSQQRALHRGCFRSHQLREVSTKLGDTTGSEVSLATAHLLFRLGIATGNAFRQIRLALHYRAQDLAKLWQERNGGSVGAIVSTLPMRFFSKKLIYLVMKNSLEVLDNGGMFVQFTYRQHSPVPSRVVKALRLKAWRYTRVWLNLPPAAIWVYEKPAASQEI